VQVVVAFGLLWVAVGVAVSAAVRTSVVGSDVAGIDAMAFGSHAGMLPWLELDAVGSS